MGNEIERLQADFTAAGNKHPSFSIYRCDEGFFTAGSIQAKERFRSLARFANAELEQRDIDTGNNPLPEQRFLGWLFSTEAAVNTGAWENAPVSSSNPIEKTFIGNGFFAAADALGRLPDSNGIKHKQNKKGERKNRNKEENDTLILGALLVHHGYNGASIKIHDPVGVRKLSSLTKPKSGPPVSPGRISKWFEEMFKGGHSTYKRECANGMLLISLKQLCGDYTPRQRDISVAEAGANRDDRDRDVFFLDDD